MSLSAFLLIIASALFHALYSLFVKRSTHKTIFIWSMYLTASVLIILSSVIFSPDSIYLAPGVVFYAAISALFFTLYNVSTGKAYASEGGDLSLSYPLSATAPFYIPLWAYIFLGEEMSFIAGIGILLVFVGCCFLTLQKRDSQRKLHFQSQAVFFALLAAFFYSFGAITDKIGVDLYAPIYFTSFVIVSMCLWMSSAVFVVKGLREKIGYEFKNNMLHVLSSGVILCLSFYTYRLALVSTKVSYAASIRQVSTLFGVLLGVWILKESYGYRRFLASLLIICGISLIKLF